MELIADEVVPEKPETEDVLCVDGILTSGQPFTFSVRASQGDTFEDGTEGLRYTSGLSGEAVRIRESAIALIAVITRQLPKAKAKPNQPTAK